MEPSTSKASDTEGACMAANLDSVHAEMQEVRAAAAALLNKAQGALTVADMATAVEKASGALKSAAEIENTRSELIKANEEISKLRRENQTASRRERSERIRDYVALLTPLVTIITLAATLIAQNWQFLRSERDKQEEAIDTQWRDAIRTVSTSGALSPGVVALQPFLRSSKYGEQARDMAVNLLSNSSDPVFFKNLFIAALAPATWSNVDRLLQLDRALSVRVVPLFAKGWDDQNKEFDSSKLTKDEKSTFDYVVDHAGVSITAQIGILLKSPGAQEGSIDFSSTYFTSADWKGVDLTGANLSGAYFDQMDLKDAELKGATLSDSTYFNRTAWWEVKSLSKTGFELLKKNCPFLPGEPYGPTFVRPSQEAVDAEIRRLSSQVEEQK
jgi:uncharacterized protein YjbI with pentapeptide repeats/flagellar hook-basal body complex protein FliE